MPLLMLVETFLVKTSLSAINTFYSFTVLPMYSSASISLCCQDRTENEVPWDVLTVSLGMPGSLAKVGFSYGTFAQTKRPGKNCMSGVPWHFWSSSQFFALHLLLSSSKHHQWAICQYATRSVNWGIPSLTELSYRWSAWGIGMFEAMRLSTHVLSSPCTITRSEAR